MRISFMEESTTGVAYLLLTQQPQFWFPLFPKKCSQKKLSLLVTLIQGRWLEESEQWLENVDWTHLVLASGNPVVQKG